MGWFSKMTVCPSCGQKIANDTLVICPRCKAKLIEVEPEIARRVKNVSFWIAFYGCLQCVYWVLDTLVFLVGDSKETGFTLSGWTYSFTRLAVGVALIYFARQAKRRTDMVASFLFYTMWVLSAKFILMLLFDGLFYNYHVAQEFGQVDPVYKPFGIGILITLFFYVVNQKKAIRELKQQR